MERYMLDYFRAFTHLECYDRRRNGIKRHKILRSLFLQVLKQERLRKRFFFQSFLTDLHYHLLTVASQPMPAYGQETIVSGHSSLT